MKNIILIASAIIYMCLCLTLAYKVYELNKEIIELEKQHENLLRQYNALVREQFDAETDKSKYY